METQYLERIRADVDIILSRRHKMADPVSHFRSLMEIDRKIATFDEELQARETQILNEINKINKEAIKIEQNVKLELIPELSNYADQLEMSNAGKFAKFEDHYNHIKFLAERDRKLAEQETRKSNLQKSDFLRNQLFEKLNSFLPVDNKEEEAVIGQLLALYDCCELVVRINELVGSAEIESIKDDLRIAKVDLNQINNFILVPSINLIYSRTKRVVSSEIKTKLAQIYEWLGDEAIFLDILMKTTIPSLLPKSSIETFQTFLRQYPSIPSQFSQSITVEVEKICVYISDLLKSMLEITSILVPMRLNRRPFCVASIFLMRYMIREFHGLGFSAIERLCET